MNRVLSFYDKIQDTVCNKLLHELNPAYKYHTLRHTLDVIETAAWISQAEGLCEDEMNVLKIAALFHDTGYLFQRHQHEQLSVDYFLKTVSPFDFPEEEKKVIASAIMATRIPQQPTTLIEKILCDADLDYLGRDDFGEISNLLYSEFKTCGLVHSLHEWNLLQVEFIGTHKYHTAFSKSHRTIKLHENLQTVRNYVKIVQTN